MNNKQKTKVQKKSDSKAIKSAGFVAFFRAIGACDKDAKNPDYLAKTFFSKKTTVLYWIVQRILNSFKKSMEKTDPGGYWYFQVRTMHIDKVFKETLKDDFEQVVILGAGYDSRAYRFQKELSGIRVFEVDYPPTQENKKQKLIKHYGSLSNRIVYVPIDFNSQSLEDVLPVSGYDSHKKTYFIWEGVSCYLPEDSVNQVLDFISNNALTGSSIVFDYVLGSFIAGDYSTYGSELLAKRWEKMGEPGLFGIEDGSIEIFLNKRGFNLLSDYGPEELEAAYLTGEDGKQKGQVWGCFRIAQASCK